MANSIEKLNDFFNNVSRPDFYADKETQNQINEIALNYPAGNVKSKDVMVNAGAICFITEALGANYNSENELNTMSYVVKEASKNIDPALYIMDVRQLTFEGYRNVLGIKRGFEFNPNQFYQECSLNSSVPYLIACELLANNLDVVTAGNKQLQVPNMARHVAREVLQIKKEILAAGKVYDAESKKIAQITQKNINALKK